MLHMTKDLLKQIAADHGMDPIDILIDHLTSLRDAPAEPRYVSFEMQHIDANPSENDDAVMKCYVDGYPADENAAGTVIACVSLTRHGDMVVDWHHNGYRMEPSVLELINDAKNLLSEEKDKRRMKGE